VPAPHDNLIVLPPLEVTRGEEMLVRAPAKINLNLLVGPRRDDGFHPIDSYLAKVSLYDELVLRLRPGGRIAFHCEGTDCGADEKNLSLRAAKLLAAPGRGADISLRKRIPPGKGLGGGSSDAAATLWGLSQLWDLRIPPEELAVKAAELGSDVPVFFGPQASRATGRGEVVEPATVRPFHAILYLGPFSCSTPEVYRQYDVSPPPAARQIDAEPLRDPPVAWRGRLENQLGPAARLVCPPLGDAWDRLAAASPAPVHMSGSGSALFILCNDPAETDGIWDRLPADLRADCTVVRLNGW
jgi:4-diphosphocytidyl-2-C-methyl-D-erythritol kinase